MSMMWHPELIKTPPVRKLELDGDLRMVFLKKLRNANIHRGSLFPDLDGFSRFLAMDWEIDRDDMRVAMERPVEPPVDDTEN
jgi:hypothetical protein